MESSQSRIQVTLASPWKRIFAWVYDLLPATGVFALVMVLGLMVVNLVGLAVTELNSEQISSSLSLQPLWIIYLICGVAYFYIWCWHKGGQTPGLKTWRLKLVKEDGSLLNWREASLRALASCGGLGNLWAFIDADNRAWQDILVNAYLVEVPKNR